jgi:hypothetical protein
MSAYAPITHASKASANRPTTRGSKRRLAAKSSTAPAPKAAVVIQA